MVYGRYKYSNARAEWGDIFGLSPADLTSQQLMKIKLEKLVEFIPTDSRIDDVLSGKIAGAKLEEWTTLSTVKEPEELTKIPNTIVKYNELVREKCAAIDKLNKDDYYNNRERYIFWYLLDDYNKHDECTRWLNSEKSVFNPKDADFGWWYQKYPDTAEKMVVKVLSNANNNPSVASRMVGLLPKDPLLRHIETVFKCDKGVYMHALSNAETPKSYIIKALRSISGKRRRIPSINVELSKAILSTIPPVMRLGVLETLFFYMRGGTVTFKDIQKSEDLDALLLGVAIKQNHRVQRLIQQFKHQYERRNTP